MKLHRIGLVALAVLLAGPALAQTTPQPRHRVHHVPARRAAPGVNPNQPVDVGPFTPEANRAYNGGGVILQGAPGAPAPSPRTPLPPQN